MGMERELAARANRLADALDARCRERDAALLRAERAEWERDRLAEAAEAARYHLTRGGDRDFVVGALDEALAPFAAAPASPESDPETSNWLARTLTPRTDPTFGWRRLLWLRHGCPLPALYGDDGEMSCGRCLLDFRRMTAEEIDEAWKREGMRKLAESAASPESGEGAEPMKGEK